jgi:protein gp37
MGLSKISWTDFTFNPWIGCSKVKDSPACENCYAWLLDVNRFSKTLGGGTKEHPISHWGAGAPRHRTSASGWRAPSSWHVWPLICDHCERNESAKNRTSVPICGNCGGTMHKARVFSLSLGDWLDDEIPIEWLADFLRVIHDTPNLDWLLLTKRPENWKPQVARALTCSLTHGYASDERYAVAKWVESWLNGEPPTNVRIGITAENQFNYDRRLHPFLDIPAYSRFLSIEPMCGPIDLILNHCQCGSCRYCEKMFEIGSHIHQVIVGGESGPSWQKNILNLDAMRRVFGQCQEFGIKRFAKQDSAFKPGQRGRIPDDLWVQEFPV